MYIVVASLKEQCVKIFVSQFFLQPMRPPIDKLKYFLIWLQFLTDIRIESLRGVQHLGLDNRLSKSIYKNSCASQSGIQTG